MNTEQKSTHAQGPWTVEERNQETNLVRVAGADGITVCNAKGHSARRIVACVNACAGMADPEVWIGMQEKEAAFAKTEIPRLAGQVDLLSSEVERLREVLVGVTRILEAFSYTTQFGKTQRARLEAARAALESAE